jgi:hypothetical protein
MPASLEKIELAVFEMSHAFTNCAKIEPMSHETAAELVANMAAELNSGFMTELGEPIVAESDPDDGKAGEEPNKYADLKLIFIGGSHAYRMAAAADNLGLDVENMATPGFRVTDSSVENAVELLRDILEGCEKRAVVIYHLYDNNIFFSCKQDGSRALPEKMDGVYHVEGRLEFVDYHTVKHLVNNTVPLLRAGGDFEKIILSPFLRYLKSCCKDKGHLTNRKDPEYFGKLGEAIRNMRESIKDTVYGKKIRNFKVLDPTALLEADDDDDVATAVKLKSYLRDDPVHLNSDGYADIVQGLLDKILDGEFTRKSRGGHYTFRYQNCKEYKKTGSSPAVNGSTKTTPSHRGPTPKTGEDEAVAKLVAVTVAATEAATEAAREAADSEAVTEAATRTDSSPTSSCLMYLM